MLFNWTYKKQLHNIMVSRIYVLQYFQVDKIRDAKVIFLTQFYK